MWSNVLGTFSGQTQRMNELPPPTYPDIGSILNEKYQVTRKIGAGSFGAIFEVQDVESGRIYAVKLERPNTPSPQLEYEFKLYRMLDAAVGVPRVYEFWAEPNWRAMVMDRLGCSLGYFFRKCGKILSMKTVLMCAIQMLCRLEYLHLRSFIHRDIKPDNFVFGVGSRSTLLHIIDLGLAKKYRDLQTHDHVNYSEDRGLAGTARYVSINVHQGVEQSCRDDLESVGYVLISLVKGKLPWQGLDAGSKVEKYDLISQAKVDTPLEVLCEELPVEFFQYMQRVRALRFDERPNYPLLRGLFMNLMVKMNYAFDYQYDWSASRVRRLDGALRGTVDPLRVIIPVKGREILEETKPFGRKCPCQPLPFFTMIHEAARFVGMSKSFKQPKEQAPKDQGEINVIGKAEQEALICDPRYTTLPKAPVETDFETHNA